MMIDIPKDLLERALKRFWAKVHKTSECWNWTGKIDNCGRGGFWWRNKVRTAARVSYEIHFKDIPKGLCVLHRCDNPKCVNPGHLFLGTPKDNSVDMKRKGRSCFGEKQGNSKLKETEVIEMKDRYLNNDISQKQLAKEYGISRCHTSDILNGKKWSYLNE